MNLRSLAVRLIHFLDSELKAMSAQIDSLKAAADAAIANSTALKSKLDAAVADNATKQAQLEKAQADLTAALANAVDPTDQAAIQAIIQSLNDSTAATAPTN